MDSSISLREGKVFSGYLFLGGCISVTLLGLVQGIDNLKPNELVFFIVSTGALLGSIVSTTGLHRIAGYLFFQLSLQQALESEYKSLEEPRTDYYFRFLFFLGLLTIIIFSLSPLGRNSYETILNHFFKDDFDFTFITIIFWILFIISALSCIKSIYSNRGKLMIIRFLIHAIEDNEGVDNLSEDLKKIREKILDEHWKEAELHLTNIIKKCLSASKDYDSMVNLKQYGFLYFDFRNLKQNKQRLDHEIDTLHDLFIARKKVLKRREKQIRDYGKSKVDPSFNLVNLKRNLEDLNVTFKNWKTKNWEEFFNTNLPWWLKLDIYSFRLLNKIYNLIKTLKNRIT